MQWPCWFGCETCKYARPMRRAQGYVQDASSMPDCITAGNCTCPCHAGRPGIKSRMRLCCGMRSAFTRRGKLGERRPGATGLHPERSQTTPTSYACWRSSRMQGPQTAGQGGDRFCRVTGLEDKNLFLVTELCGAGDLWRLASSIGGWQVESRVV